MKVMVGVRVIVPVDVIVGVWVWMGDVVGVLVGQGPPPSEKALSVKRESTNSGSTRFMR
jgi:hypothetical protein